MKNKNVTDHVLGIAKAEAKSGQGGLLSDFLITQGQVNKYSQYKSIYSSLSLNNHSSCAERHIGLILCYFP
jgi:hypothetical protein